MLLRKTTLSLPVNLTAAEIDLKGREVARQAALVDKLEDEEKDRAKAAKDTIKVETATLLRLSRECNDGVETRPVECEQHLHEGTMLVDTVRMDTGAVVGTRPANNVEMEELERSRQIKMPLSERRKRDRGEDAETA